MDDLDFGDLTDDQLLGLIRAALCEAARRSDDTATAAQAAWLDETERVRIAREAAEREAAKLRAAERERVAREAAEAVRSKAAAAEQQRAAGRADADRAAALAKAREAGARERQRQAEAKAWLRRAAALVDRRPEEICLLHVGTRFGWRVLINGSTNRYSDEHLIDYRHAEAKLSTVRALIRRKPELIEFCVEFRSAHAAGGNIPEVAYCGDEFDWTDTPNSEAACA